MRKEKQTPRRFPSIAPGMGVLDALLVMTTKF